MNDDTARLDWLEATNATLSDCGKWGKSCCYRKLGNFGLTVATGQTFREAIDAAMEASVPSSDAGQKTKGITDAT